jgi:hypothetical protein
MRQLYYDQRVGSSPMAARQVPTHLVMAATQSEPLLEIRLGGRCVHVEWWGAR